ncbi:hypothetical protein, partial [Adlercreutzia caecimuris]|uniref:hypothetical protein n=1 Tax=Adlercreutzia caecimuris TaxID=671266 RepID=UPI00258D5DC9
EISLGLPSSVSGCEGAAGPLPAAVSRERRKEVLYAYPFQLSRTFFEIFSIAVPAAGSVSPALSRWRVAVRAFLKRGLSILPFSPRERKGVFSIFLKKF